ncbi:MAG: zinc ribbon domain-containing protein [Thermoplasmata archaeon]
MKFNKGGKLFIISVVIIMMVSYSPLLVSGNPSSLQPSTNGNLYIQNGTTFIINEYTVDPLTGQTGQFGMSGSLFVNSSATLIIENATLYFRQDILHHYRMFVNGTLIMNNAVIETSYNSVEPYLPLNISFYDALVRTNGAHFLFPGKIYFYKSTLIMKNTYFDKLPGIPDQLNQGNTTDSSPTPSFYYSTGYFDNVYFKNMFNPTPIGLIYFINSTASKTPLNISAGSLPYTEYSTLKSSSYPSQTVISEISLDLNYISNSNATITLYADGKNISISNGTLLPTSGKELHDNITISELPFPLRLYQLYNDNLYIKIKDTSKTGYFNLTKLNFLLSTNDTFNYYGGNSSFYFNMVSTDIYGMNVFIDSNFLNDTLYNGLEQNIKNIIDLKGDSNLSIANLTVSGSLNGTNQMNDNPPFLVDKTSEVNLFRFADVIVKNYQGYPVSGLKIGTTETWPNNYPNAEQLVNMTAEYNSNLQNILVSNGFIQSNFDYTSDGVASIPLLSDIFTNSTSPNTLIMGHYELLLPGGANYNLTLDSFPSMSSYSNTARVNITYDSPFVYFYINSMPQLIYGNSVNIGLTATSYGSSIIGTFVIMSNGTEIDSYSISLKSNITSEVEMPFVDSLAPGKHNLSIAFVSSQVYSSPPPLSLNITSYSNVELVSSAVLNAKYEMNGNIISGYKSNLSVTVKNLGNDSSGVVQIETNYSLPNGQSYSFPMKAIINGKSEITQSFVIPAINISTQGTINIKVSTTPSNGVVPYSTLGENFSTNYSIIPKPIVKIVSASFNNSYLFGLNANGNILLESNEAVSNITLTLGINGKILDYNLSSINGFFSIPISIPYKYLELGNNNVSLFINNSEQPYLNISLPTIEHFIVERNYQFIIENVAFILNSNITGYVNGSLFFTIANSGNFSVSSVPIEILYNGIQVFAGNETVNVPVQIPLNVSYSYIMNFEVIADYNFLYPTSFTYYPYMYYNSSLKLPYFYSSYSLPTQLINGSSIKGYFSINDITNYYSNNTMISFYLDSYLISQKYLGNLSIGYSGTLNINISTSTIPDLMRGNVINQFNSYILIKNSETGIFGIKINTGLITILERPNFVLSNITINVNNHNTSMIYAGEPFVVKFNVTNNGGIASTGNIPFVIIGKNNTTNMFLYKGSTNESIYPGQTVQIITQPIPTKSVFSGILLVYFNYNDTIKTVVPGTLNYTIPLNIVNPKLIFIITPLYPNIKTGSLETLEIRAINSNNSQPWQTNITVTVEQGSKIIEKVTGTTNSLGIYTLSFKVINSGNYNVVINYQGPVGIQTLIYSGVFSVKQAPIEIPSFIYPIIIIVAVVIVFFYLINYFRNKNVGMVQCSVCGAILPEGTTKCPRCGTEFEKDRVKCSECGSWIPEDSKYCPNCGALFINKHDPEYTGMSKLKVEYEQFLDSYRQKAKSVLGDKMNEQEFQSWWRNNPDYKSFRQWIMEKGISPEEPYKAEVNTGEENVKAEKKKGLLRRNKK